jgi:RNA polymerase sigma factor (sigma-70 family)
MKKGRWMAKKKPSNEIISYKLADGQTVPVETSPAVARSLRNEERRERSRSRDDRRFLDAGGYTDGETELLLQGLDESVVEQVEYRQRSAMVKDAVSALPPRQRKFILAYYFQCYTIQDIANREHVAKQTVHRVLQKARGNLKRIIIKNSRFYGLHPELPKK